FRRGLGALAAARRRVGLARRFRRRLVLVALRQGLLGHRFLGGFRRFAFGAFALHLLHRLAVVVEAEVPGPPAEWLDFEARRLAADRAAFLELEDVTALRQGEGLIAGVGVVGDPAAAADEALAGLLGADHAQHVGRAVLLLAAGFFADLAG